MCLYIIDYFNPLHTVYTDLFDDTLLNSGVNFIYWLITVGHGFNDDFLMMVYAG